MTITQAVCLFLLFALLLLNTWIASDLPVPRRAPDRELQQDPLEIPGTDPEEGLHG